MGSIRNCDLGDRHGEVCARVGLRLRGRPRERLSSFGLYLLLVSGARRLAWLSAGILRVRLMPTVQAFHPFAPPAPRCPLANAWASPGSSPGNGGGDPA